VQPIILASSSSARKRLLDLLPLTFDCIAPNIDETQLPGEPPLALVKRLSLAKAEAVAGQPKTPRNALIIAGDQLAHYNGEVFGKPGNLSNAKMQLQCFSGNKVEFLSGLCVYNCDTGHHDVHVEHTHTYYRELNEERIDWYLKHDNPIHCAGSIKLESLGICLCEKITSDDPYALSGIPMLRLVHFLEQHGVEFS